MYVNLENQEHAQRTEAHLGNCAMVCRNVKTKTDHILYK